MYLNIETYNLFTNIVHLIYTMLGYSFNSLDNE
jgi:hypothetical protein